MIFVERRRLDVLQVIVDLGENNIVRNDGGAGRHQVVIFDQTQVGQINAFLVVQKHHVDRASVDVLADLGNNILGFAFQQSNSIGHA